MTLHGHAKYQNKITWYTSEHSVNSLDNDIRLHPLGEEQTQNMIQCVNKST